MDAKTHLISTIKCDRQDQVKLNSAEQGTQDTDMQTSRTQQ